MTPPPRAYRIQVAARVSGVKEGLIRAWERRYGVLAPVRTPGGYRTYSDADIQVLKRLKELTEEGVSIAQAVQQLPSIRREVAAAPQRIKVARPDQLEAWRAEIIEAAQRLDQGRIEAALDEALESSTPLVFYDELVTTLLREVGELWHQGTLTVAEEHLISNSVRQRLISLIASAPRRALKHVVCACPPEDEHELGLLGAALHFRHAGFQVTFLGARTPVEHLARAVRRLVPDLVAISVIATTGVEAFVAALAAALPEGTRVVLGGHGIHRHAALAEGHGFQVMGPGTPWSDILRSTK